MISRSFTRPPLFVMVKLFPFTSAAGTNLESQEYLPMEENRPGSGRPNGKPDIKTLDPSTKQIYLSV